MSLNIYSNPNELNNPIAVIDQDLLNKASMQFSNSKITKMSIKKVSIATNMTICLYRSR